MVNGACLFRASLAHAAAKHPTECTAAAEELRKQILGIHSTSATAVLETLLTILILDLTLLGIRQDLVSVRQLLEFLRSIGVVGILVCTAEANVSGFFFQIQVGEG